MQLSSAQATALANALKAEANPAVQQANAIGDCVFLADWCNGNSASDAWSEAVSGRDLADATSIAKFAALGAGQRDAWRLLLSFAPIDTTRQKTRKAIEDIWGVDASAVLTDCKRRATRAEAYIAAAMGDPSPTAGGVTALKLSWTGTLDHLDIGRMRLANP